MTAVAAEPVRINSVEMRRQDFTKIREILYAESGISISDEKMSLVQSRLAKRLRELGLQRYSEYLALLSGPDGRDERVQLISALTTNVTNFFREQHHFEHLHTEVSSRLRQRLESGERVRMWSAGCSTGQEAYSMAMTVHPLLEGIGKPDYKILATDIDSKVVAQGKDAVYSESLIADIPQHLRRKYLTPGTEDKTVQFVPGIRNMVSFKQLNLLEAWPMKGKFDVIFCRNVVIYFDEKTRAGLWHRFAQCLLPGGILYIGHSERLKPEFGQFFVNTGPTTYVRTDVNVPL